MCILFDPVERYRASRSQRAANALPAFHAAYEGESKTVLGPPVQAVGLGDISIPAFTLQLLFWQRAQHLLTPPEVFHALSVWKGTGRNETVVAADPGEGAALLDAMVAADLVWLMDTPKRVLVSPKGIALLSGLSPACEDPDLPWRLLCWERDWPASRESSERWLSSFFARQRRFVPAAAPDRGSVVGSSSP